MKRRYHWELTILLLVLFLFLSHESRSAEKAGKNLSEAMHGLHEVSAGLLEMLSSPQEFANPKNRRKLKESINKISALSRSVKEQTAGSVKTPTQITAERFQRHIDKISDHYNRGRLEEARWMFNASFNYCVSCHTQMPQPKAPLLDWKVDLQAAKSKTAFERAEFLFITRRFALATGIYDRLIRIYPGSNLDDEQIETATLRKLMIFARIERHPQRAVGSFSRDLRNTMLPTHVKNNIRSWIADFKKWGIDGGRIEKLNSVDLLKQIEIELEKKFSSRTLPAESPYLVTFLRYSGAIYERLQSEPEGKTRAELLYQLARIERQLAVKYIFSIYESYFAECAQADPTWPVQQKCEQEVKALEKVKK